MDETSMHGAYIPTFSKARNRIVYRHPYSSIWQGPCKLQQGTSYSNEDCCVAETALRVLELSHTLVDLSMVFIVFSRDSTFLGGLIFCRDFFPDEAHVGWDRGTSF